MSKTPKQKFETVMKRKMLRIHRFKERYVEAWLAETGLMPTECALVEGDDGSVFLRKLTPEEIETQGLLK